mgnify:CR=1 FL=1
MKNKPYFPMFIDLSDKNIVVAGGGNIATRRIKTLLKFTRNITVVATKVTQELMDLGKAGTVTLYIRPVKRSDFANAYMVIAASQDWKLNEQICKVCKEEGIYVNVSGDKEESDFYFPGLCIADDSVIGIQTGSTDTARKRELREETDQVLTRLTKKWKAADE